MKIGDRIDVYWRETGRHDIGLIEEIGPISVMVRIPGPPEITMIVTAANIGEDGPNRWRLDL